MMGLGYLEIHQAPYKLGADLYIDDHALRYTGNWLETEVEVNRLLDE